MALKDDSLKVVQTFIGDRFELSGSNGVILGLSGGLDSAVVLSLCASALDPKKVTALYMPVGEGNREDLDQSGELARSLKVNFRVVNIRPTLESVQSHLNGEVRPFVLGNIAARIRMILLFSEANQRDLMVMGTSNKSELLTGYFTKFGDGAADLLPIGDLYKTQVRDLAKRLGLPAHFITKPPSAGLIEGQTDEDDLGVDYTMLDRILLGYELGMSSDEIIRRTGAEAGVVENVLRRVKNAIHKRNLPAVPKLGIRTVGLDLREEYLGRQ